jgi:hypothetical protein
MLPVLTAEPSGRLPQHHREVQRDLVTQQIRWSSSAARSPHAHLVGRRFGARLRPRRRASVIPLNQLCA